MTRIGGWSIRLFLLAAFVRCGGEAFSAAGDDAGVTEELVPPRTSDAASDATEGGQLEDTTRASDSAADVGAEDRAAADDRAPAADAGDAGEAGNVEASGDDGAAEHDSGAGDASEDRSVDAGCGVTCGNLCCTTAQHCCQITAVTLDGGPKTYYSCVALNAVCPLAAATH